MWRKCKLLGSLLDTEKDINRRQIIAIDAFKTLTKIVESRKISNAVKTRIFNAYMLQVYSFTTANCRPSPKKLENTINTFQRRHLRKILGIHWPKKITNIELYTKTKTERRRLNWLGHLMRLNPETPARLALVEYLRKVKRPKGRPQRTWMELIKHDLKAIVLNYNKANKTIEQLTQMAHGRNYWRNIVRRVVLQN